MNAKADSNNRVRDFGFEEVKLDEHAARVRGVFDSVAGRYDLMNDLMSGGLHRVWKKLLIDRLDPRPAMRLADIAAGTGDIAFRMRARLEQAGKSGPQHPITLCDPNSAMLEQAESRAIDRGYLSGFDFVTAPAESLPFADRSFDGATISFGLRNVTDRAAAMAEFHRVMDFGGHFLCLEFSPAVLPVLKPVYDAYSLNVLPWLGQRVADDAESYRYLAESIRTFPEPETLAGEFRAAGFGNVTWQPLSGGIVAIHSAWRV